MLALAVGCCLCGGSRFLFSIAFSFLCLIFGLAHSVFFCPTFNLLICLALCSCFRFVVGFFVSLAFSYFFCFSFSLFSCFALCCLRLAVGFFVSLAFSYF